MKKTLFVAVFLYGHLYATLAQPSGGFTAYAHNPVKTPDSLLVAWKTAAAVRDQFKAALALIHFHQSSGASDSVLLYAEAMRDQLKEHGREGQLSYRAELDHATAAAYQEKGLYDEALRFYLQGIGAGEQLNDQRVVNKNKFGQAMVYFYRNEYDKSLPLYHAIQQFSKDSNLVQQVNKQLGIIYLARGELPTAKKHLDAALSYFEQTGQRKNALETRLNLAVILETTNEPDAAYAAFTDIKDAAQQAAFYDLYIKATLHIGDILLKKKDYENAQIVLSMAYMNAVQWEDLEAQRRATQSLQRLYVAKGDYQNAYALMTQYVGVLKEITAKQNKREVNELEIKYNTAQKEKELLQKENQLQHQRTIKYGLLIGFLVVLLPVIGLLYLYYQKLQTQSRLNASMEEANRQQITAMLKEKELEVLKASVESEEKERKRISKELHDSIGGDLAAIKMQLFNKKNEALDTVLFQLDDTCRQVRDLSHHLAPRRFSNTGFTELIQTYLQKFRNAGKPEIRFQVYPEDAINGMDTGLKVELYKIIQELMTNAQKHADAAVIELQLTRVDDALKLIFEDNGRGFRTDKIPAGIGLQNIRERLATLRGTITIDSSPGRGTVADIEIPLNK